MAGSPPPHHPAGTTLTSAPADPADGVSPPPVDAPPPVADPHATDRPAGVTRREALNRLAIAGAAVLGASGAALLLHDRKGPGSAATRLSQVRDYRRPEPPAGPELVFARRCGTDHARVGEQCRKL
ncbi:MAG: hypothetical protein FJ125_07065, partial [Deltaproteobacteria bacterium]|nr:hypothetical protein [Deltaproteobacteria bacterium]